MSTLNLTIGERLAALKLFDAFKGSVSGLAAILDDVKKFAIKPEEWEAASLKKTPAGNGTETWNWNDEGTIEIEVAPSTLEYLKSEIKTKSEANEVTTADIALVTLDKKLNA